MTCCGIAWHRSLMLQLVSWQEKTCHRIAWRSAPLFLCALARNDLLLCSVACRVVQHCYSSCRGQVHCAVACLFVTQQEMTRCSIPHHCSLFCSKKQCTAAFCGIARHGVMAMFRLFSYCKDGENNNQPVQHWLPLWHSGSHFGLVGSCVFLQRLLLCCFLRVEKTINLFGSLGSHCGWWHFGFLHFFAIALHIPPQCFAVLFCASACFMCHGIALCAVGIALCATAQSLLMSCHCVVPWHCRMCHGIAQCAGFCAMALCYVP